MNQEIQKSESSVPAFAPPPSTQQAVLKSDIVIPKVLSMQGISKRVMSGDNRAGQLVRSTTGEVLGGTEKKVCTPLEFIPLKYDSLWMLEEYVPGQDKPKFRGYEPRTAANEAEEWEFIGDNGNKWKRTKTMHLYALLPSDIDKQIQAIETYKSTGEMPDVDAALLPVVIPFRVTSFKAAKAVSTLFLKAETLAAEMGVPVPVYGRTMVLKNFLDKNDLGEFYVSEVEPGGKTKPEHVAKAKFWLDQMNALGSQIKVDDSDEKKGDTGTSDASSGEVPF